MRIFKHYISWHLALLVMAEVVIVFVSIYATQCVRQALGYGFLWSALEAVYAQAMVLAFTVCIAFYILGLYDLGCIFGRGELLVKLGAGLVATFLLTASINFLIPSWTFHRTDFLLWTSLFLPLAFCGRLGFYWAINLNKEKVLILGVNEIARSIAVELAHGKNHGFEIQGFVAENPEQEAATLGYATLGLVTELEQIVRAHQPHVVVVALSERRGTFPYREILDCKLEGVRVEDWPTFYEKLTGKIIIQNLRPSWLIFADGFARNHLARTLKSLTDVLLAALGLCLALPIMLLLACLIKLDSRGSVFFRQERVGEKGKIFTLYKFRTMVQDAEKDTGPVWAQNADPRTTRLGLLLRRTGLDEIPQMLNVLKGDMSFVGPRPERPHFVAELQEKIPYYSQRLVVKPGITGWAQVRYGYGATLNDAIEKLQYDLYYIKNMSCFLDMLIILSTIHKVLFAKVAQQMLPQANTDENLPQAFPRYEVPLCTDFITPVVESNGRENYAQIAQRQASQARK